MTEDEKQQIIEEEQLKWLSFFHYVSAAVTLLFSSMFIFHVVIFGIIAANPGQFESENAQNAEGIVTVMQVFATALGVFVLLGVTYGILEILSGVFIRRRKHRVFSLVVAIPRLLCIPYGTILSILTLILLERPTVRQRYASQQASARAGLTQDGD